MKTTMWLLSTAAIVGAFASPALAYEGSGAEATRADLGGLMGHTVQTVNGDRIGKVDAILAARDGQITTVIVHNYDREIALGWQQFRFADHGNKVMVAMTKTQVRALPDYKNAEVASGDTVFTTSAGAVPLKQEPRTASTVSHTAARSAAPTKPIKTASSAPMKAASSEPMKTASSEPAKTGAAPAVAAPLPSTTKVGSIVGLGVDDGAGNRIGQIEDLYVNSHGKVDKVLVGVGGFLGVGERDVALDWNSLKFSDNGKKVAIDMTKDQLNALPPVGPASSHGKATVVGSIAP